MTAMSLNIRGHHVLIDAADWPLVEGFNWKVEDRSGFPRVCAQNKSRRGGWPTTVYIYRIIMGASPGQHVDHVNGDTLDNRRANLRLASPSQNGANRNVCKNKTGFRGVSRTRAKSSRWIGETMKDRRHHRTGPYDTIVEAARAYDALAIKVHGEFARLNFPEEWGRSQ